MDKAKRKQRSIKEKTQRYRMKSNESSARRRHSDSDPNEHRKPKRPNQVVESNEAFIQKLPREIMKKIFEYLDLPDICRAGRVCKEWRRLTRIAQFWRRISVTICNNYWFRLIQYLPSCVTYINLFSDTELTCISYSTFSSTLYRKCPNLDTLIMHRFSFSRTYENIYPNLARKLRVLVLTSCNFVDKKPKAMHSFESTTFENMSTHVCAIEFMDVSHSRFTNKTGSRFMDFGWKTMSKLKKLHLTGCNLDHYFSGMLMDLPPKLQLLNLEQNYIDDVMIGLLGHRAIHLTELYVCWSSVKDKDLICVEETTFPCLVVICLRGCRVSSVGISSLIYSRYSLRCVVVGEEVPNLASDYFECNSEIVKIVNGYKFCNHNKIAIDE